MEAILGAHVTRVEPGVVHYETLDGLEHTLDFDFGMLLPPFGGVPLKAFDRDGADITDRLFAPSGFMKVDADYTPKPYEEWRADDWPKTYQAVGYDNIWAVGIAFAPPHQISRPRKSANGTVIAPSPPRTGMPSGRHGEDGRDVHRRPDQEGRRRRRTTRRRWPRWVRRAWRRWVRACGPGSAAAMTMMPVVPDYQRYATGRDLADTRGEVGLAGHWVKLMLHYLFIYKAKALPGWQLIPE